MLVINRKIIWSNWIFYGYDFQLVCILCFKACDISLWSRTFIRTKIMFGKRWNIKSLKKKHVPPIFQNDLLFFFFFCSNIHTHILCHNHKENIKYLTFETNIMPWYLFQFYKVESLFDSLIMEVRVYLGTPVFWSKIYLNIPKILWRRDLAIDLWLLEHGNLFLNHSLLRI